MLVSFRRGNGQNQHRHSSITQSKGAMLMRSYTVIHSFPLTVFGNWDCRITLLDL